VTALQRGVAAVERAVLNGLISLAVALLERRMVRALARRRPGQ
jgi:Flp pilus assembly pilin Flp